LSVIFVDLRIYLTSYAGDCSRLGKGSHCVVYICGSMSRREHEAELKGTPVRGAMQNCPHTTAEQLPVQVNRNRVAGKRNRLHGKKTSAASEARLC
jgi:hypothetical protein